MPDSTDLSGAHIDTLKRLFRHPTSHNIEWHDLLSLLKAVGSVEEHRDGRYQVTIGSDSTVVNRPLEKDIDMETITEMRRVLRNAGLEPDAGT